MKIAHLSDLHFGTEKPFLVEQLIREMNRINPDLIVISGDLTQRATVDQYQAVRNFINAIGTHKVLCVPGNHDISLYNLVERLIFPFRKYRRYIHPHIWSVFKNDKVAVFGINSVTPYKTMSGYITNHELDRIKQFFDEQPADIFKIAVMHHNLVKSERHKVINDAEKIINVFAECGINLILSGHIHYACIETLNRSFFSHNMYVVTAGTAISTRTIVPNSFNVLTIDNSAFEFTVHCFEDDEFKAIKPLIFRK
ncbi:MAG: metallophosphoesterase [Gammaproteobacteria bacterium]